MSKSRMFDFITRTHNPIGGGHIIQPDGSIKGCFGCTYCWATALKEKHRWSKYLGPYRIIDKEILKRFKTDDFVFAADMVDIGHPRMPAIVLYDFWRWVKMQPCPVLTLTKNPAVYHKSRNYIPENAVLGMTMETDFALIGEAVSKAPDVLTRYLDMKALMDTLPNRRFVAVEPALKFSNAYRFAINLIELDPWAVAIGYDNYDNHLPEPRLEETETLIRYLEKAGVKVYRKTIRRAWDE